MTKVLGQLRDMLKEVAQAIGPDLRERCVFVGGCTTALFITDPVTLEDVRATDDVDLAINLSGYGEWVQLLEYLRERGFSEHHEDQVICRMRLGDLKVDFMPDDGKILGFSNRWYPQGIKTALTYPLSDTLMIKHLRPEVFIATELDAFLGRGENDLLMSRDVEDILLVVDGRPELVSEIKQAEHDVKSFIVEQFEVLQQHDGFE